MTHAKAEPTEDVHGKEEIDELARGAMVPDGTPPLMGFPVDPVFTLDNVTSTTPLGDDVRPCLPPYHDHTCVCGTTWTHGYGACSYRGYQSSDCPACAPEKYV